MTVSHLTSAALAAWTLVSAASAQDAAAPTPSPAPSRTVAAPEARDLPPSVTPLRVQVVFSKFHGDRKVASLPYALICNAGERQAAVLRVGVEVPVPTAPVITPSKDSAFVPAVQYQYKNVGTNIDCRSGAASPDGRYRLEINVEQSSIYSAADDQAGHSPSPAGQGKADWMTANVGVGNAPMFRTFRSTFNPILRDGQTVQYTAATDPVSGEVVKIDVTVNVVK